MLPDFELIGKSQCFPLYYYEPKKSTAPQLPGLTSDTPYEPAHEIYVGGQDEVVDEEATLNSGTPLTEVFTCEMTASADGTWQRGKHYVYDVVFGLDEILVSPSVTEWDDVQTSVPVQ